MGRTRDNKDRRRWGQLSHTAQRHAMFGFLAFGAQKRMGREGDMAGVAVRSPVGGDDEGGGRCRVMSMADNVMVYLGRGSGMRRRSIGNKQQNQAQECEQPMAQPCRQGQGLA
ncbi:hypothetical protein KZO25_03180 [Halomonas sp. ANAO-440]|uniref:hypothetical protein n=1 Tax=Halomonas sp. ANAO-440 TaxID=2861360 RepID=UPI001CAA4C31|nr:hypothetical protein [Halomonas sp. ANAO-440]MBZ0329315.1 hypothetical protein [Halomonas sp. ANAO-440]